MANECSLEINPALRAQATKLLTRMASIAEGLCGVLWFEVNSPGDKERLAVHINTIQVQIENLQADLNELIAIEREAREVSKWN